VHPTLTNFLPSWNWCTEQS